jgi:peptidyl-prolyl cis-trans isomerase C
MNGCFWKSSDESKTVVLSLDKSQMTAKEFALKLAKRMSQFDALAAKDNQNLSKAKDEIIKDFIIRGVTVKWANEQGLIISDSEKKSEFEKVRGTFPNDLEFRRALAEEEISLDQWKQGIEYRLLEQAVFKKITEKVMVPNPEEIQSYYNSNKEQFKIKERIFLRQIVLTQNSDAEKIADALKKQAFEKLAIQFSIAPEAKSGGLVGWVEKGTLEVFDKAFSQALNVIGPIEQSPYGFHIMRVEKKERPGQRPLSEVKNLIISIIKAKKEQALFSAWLDSQLRNTKIMKNNSVIRAMVVETRSD